MLIIDFMTLLYYLKIILCVFAQRSTGAISSYYSPWRLFPAAAPAPHKHETGACRGKISKRETGV
jgi:hypothetical protein